MMRYFVAGVLVLFAGLMLRVFADKTSLQDLFGKNPKTKAAHAARPAIRAVENFESEGDAAPQGVAVKNEEESKASVAPQESSVAKASEEKPSPILRVAFNHNPPRKIINGSVPSGIDVEILNQFADRIGMKLEYKMCELSECLKGLESGSADVMLGISRTAERESFIQYLDPAISLSVSKCFYQKKGSRQKINSYANLLGNTKVGVLYGYDYFPKFDRDKRIRKKTFKNYSAMIAALRSGEIDVFIGYEDRSDYTIAKKLNADDIVKASFQVRENILVHFLSMSKKSPLMSEAKRMEDVLSNMTLEGAVQKIVLEESGKFRLKSFH